MYVCITLRLRLHSTANFKLDMNQYNLCVQVLFLTLRVWKWFGGERPLRRSMIFDCNSPHTVRLPHGEPFIFLFSLCPPESTCFLQTPSCNFTMVQSWSGTMNYIADEKIVDFFQGCDVNPIWMGLNGYLQKPSLCSIGTSLLGVLSDYTGNQKFWWISWKYEENYVHSLTLNLFTWKVV